MNSNGLDEYIVDKCYSQAQQARKLHSHHDVHDYQMIRICSNLSTSSRKPIKEKPLHRTERTGEMIFEDYETNRRRELSSVQCSVSI
jgi:hypothetical protein